jgi:hypothetical protein
MVQVESRRLHNAVHGFTTGVPNGLWRIRRTMGFGRLSVKRQTPVVSVAIAAAYLFTAADSPAAGTHQVDAGVSHVAGGLTAPRGQVTLYLPLQPGPDPRGWLDLAHRAGFDTASPDFAAHIENRANEIKREQGARRKRAVQERYDAINIANTSDSNAINSEELRPQVHGLLAWCFADSIRSIDLESRSWTSSVQEAAFVSGQAEKVNHGTIALCAAQLSRDLAWRLISVGPAPFPLAVKVDLEGAVGASGFRPPNPEMFEAALHSYRSECGQALAECLQSFNSYYRLSETNATRSQTSVGRKLDALVGVQLKGIESIAQCAGSGGKEWRASILSAFVPAGAPVFRSSASIHRLAVRAEVAEERAVLADLATELVRAEGTIIKAWRSRLAPFFAGQDWSGHEDPNAQFASSVSRTRGEVDQMIIGIIGQISDTEFRANVLSALAPLGELTDDQIWHGRDFGPSWPGGGTS